MNFNELISRQIPAESQDDIRHYIRIRKALGCLGVGIPFLVVLFSYLFYGCCMVQGSISAYYYTGSVGPFCGMLSAIGLFLITYKGIYKSENWLTNIAGGLAFCIAFIPMQMTCEERHASCGCITDLASSNYIMGHYVHYIVSAAMFILLAILSYFIFPLPPKDPTQSRHKVIRSRDTRIKIYKACGIIIASCILIIGLDLLLHYSSHWPLPALPFTFTFESIMLIAFGTSWLVKGEVV